jgi:hypothetical protein
MLSTYISTKVLILYLKVYVTFIRNKIIVYSEITNIIFIYVSKV